MLPSSQLSRQIGQSLLLAKDLEGTLRNMQQSIHNPKKNISSVSSGPNYIVYKSKRYDPLQRRYEKDAHAQLCLQKEGSQSDKIRLGTKATSKTKNRGKDSQRCNNANQIGVHVSQFATGSRQEYQTPKIDRFSAQVDQSENESNNSLGQRSNVRSYFINEQNKLLKQQIMNLKRKTKEQSKRINDQKHYIMFLEQYNDTLKQQIVLWMGRPVANHPSIITDDLGGKKGMLLVKQMEERLAEFRNNNSLNIKYVKNLRDFDQGNANQHFCDAYRCDFVSPCHETPQCTSCNYANTKKQRRAGQPAKGQSFKGNSMQFKKNGLCECHRKYIERGSFFA